MQEESDGGKTKATNDFNLRDEIEQHNEKMMKKQRHLKQVASSHKIDPDSESNKHKITRDLNLSPRSCCPRVYRCLNPVIPERLHNKPLSHMIRPVQQMIAEFNNQRRLQKSHGKPEETRKPWGVGGKKATSELAAYYKRQTHELALSMTTLKYKKFALSMQVKYLSLHEKLAMQKRIDETVKTVTAMKFVPRQSSSQFPALRKQWEAHLDRGGTFSNLRS